MILRKLNDLGVPAGKGTKDNGSILKNYSFKNVLKKYPHHHDEKNENVLGFHYIMI